MISLCRGVAGKVSREVSHLVGKKEAGEVLGMGADGSPTKRIDRVAEDCAIEALRGSGIPMVVLSEEAGKVELGEDPEYVCLLDPIDGTYNAVKGIPFFSISMAFARWSKKASLSDIEAGYILNLGAGEEFSAVRGEGATLNGEAISSSKEKIPANATFSIYHQGKGMRELMRFCGDLKRTRAFGSVALELCYVADGSLDGLADLRGYLKTTDIAAGKLILEESGGLVTDGEGKALKHGLDAIGKTSLLACGSAEMHREVRRRLEGGRR